MASLRGKNVLTSIIPKRYASSTAKAAPQAAEQRHQPLTREGLRVSKLPNGLVVASIENNSPVSRIAAVVNVGAANESYDTQGAAHLLRAASSLATKNYSQYGLSRTLDHLGGQLSVTGGREQTSYNLVTSRDKFEKLINILTDVVSKPLLKPWEVEKIQDRVQLELDVYNESPELRIVDLIHSAAFRNGLSNPLYANKEFLGNLDADLLKDFYDDNFSSDRLTLVGVGVRHDNLLRLAERIHLAKHAAQERQQSKYLGTELRQNNTSGLVHVAVACEGVSLSSKEQIASGIVQQAFGTGPRVKWSDGANRISNTVLSAANEPAMISSFNLNYADTGLFGFHVIADANESGKLVKGLFKEVAKVGKNGFSDAEIANAKTRLKASLALQLESSEGLVNQIGLAGENANVNIEELNRQIDTVSNNDVNNLTRRITTGKPSLAAIGNLKNLPNLDELSA